MGLGGLMNISSQIIQAEQGLANNEEQQVDAIKETITAAITDLKEEVMVFTQGIKKDKKIEQAASQKDLTQELMELQEKEAAEHKDTQIEKSSQKFQQATEFLTKGNQKQPQGLSEQVQNFAAAILQDSNVKKTGKKGKTTLEEKLELLAALEPDFNNLDLNPEDKEVVQEFFDKMARMKNLKNRLSQLDNVEKHYEEQEKEKEKEEQQKRDQKDPKKNKEKETNGTQATNAPPNAYAAYPIKIEPIQPLSPEKEA